MSARLRREEGVIAVGTTSYVSGVLFDGVYWLASVYAYNEKTDIMAGLIYR